jgi:hypothetical protein
MSAPSPLVAKGALFSRVMSTRSRRVVSLRRMRWAGTRERTMSPAKVWRGPWSRVKETGVSLQPSLADGGDLGVGGDGDAGGGGSGA